MADTAAPPATTRALRGDGPLWRRLAGDLRSRVALGEFPGDFPGEHALAAEYGLSRHTVREALRELRAEGLVTAARGRASRVAGSALIEQPTSALYSLFASVEAAGMRQQSVVRERSIRVDADVAEHLGLPDDTPLFYLDRVRLADGRPLALDRVWLPAAVAEPLLEADFTETALYRLLRDLCGVEMTGGSETVSARIPSDAVREVLEIDESVAVLAVDRLGTAGAEPIEWRETVLRGDLYALTAHYPPQHPSTTPGAP